MTIKKLLAVLDYHNVQVYRYTSQDLQIWEDNIERIDTLGSTKWLNARVVAIFDLNETEYNASIQAAENPNGDCVDFRQLYGSERARVLVIMVDMDWNRPIRRMLKKS